MYLYIIIIKDMTIEQVKQTIETATGVKVSIRKGKGAMAGYTYFSVNKNNKIDFNFRKEFVKQFPACDIKPAFSSDISIMIYHF
jgi:hypothetical protein